MIEAMGLTSDGVPRAKLLKPHGVFCLEGDWSTDLRNPSTVEPLLHMLRQSEYQVPYIHRNIATIDAMAHYIHQWLLKRYHRYPILYLGLHGSSDGFLHLGPGARDPQVTIDELEEGLEGLCSGRVFFFASCGMLDIHGALLNRFLRRTDALAVCGYKGDIDWLGSAAMDLLVLGSFQQQRMTVRGLQRVRRRIDHDTYGLAKGLQFRMVVKD
jgi:hypothetical protein